MKQRYPKIDSMKIACGTYSHQTSIALRKCSALSSEQNSPRFICSTATFGAGGPGGVGVGCALTVREPIDHGPPD